MAQPQGATAQLTPVAAEDASMCYGANEDCSICYGELARPTQTVCKHVFCLECLETWLQRHNTCPACRQRLYGHRANAIEDGHISDSDLGSDSDIDNDIDSRDEHGVGPFSNGLPDTVILGGEVLQDRLLSLSTRGLLEQDGNLPNWIHDIDRSYVRFTFSLRDNFPALRYGFDYITYEPGRKRRERRKARYEEMASAMREFFESGLYRHAAPRVVSYALVNGECCEEEFRSKTDTAA